jgi:hypothetical protein
MYVGMTALSMYVDIRFMYVGMTALSMYVVRYQVHVCRHDCFIYVCRSLA